MDVDLLRKALRDELKSVPVKNRAHHINSKLQEHGSFTEITEDIVHRFINEDQRSLRLDTFNALCFFLRYVNPGAYRHIQAPTEEQKRSSLRDAMLNFCDLDDAKQRRFEKRLWPRYTIIRDAWMVGDARKEAVVFTEIEFEATDLGVIAHERQEWRDDELLEKERSEDEIGIAVQFRTNFALLLKSGHSNGGLVVHIFDVWQEGKEHKISKASGISVPIISRQEQVPSAIILTEKPIRELGGPRVISRRDFMSDYPVLARKFVGAEVKHFLQGERQFQLL